MGFEQKDFARFTREFNFWAAEQQVARMEGDLERVWRIENYSEEIRQKFYGLGQKCVEQEEKCG